MIPILALLLSSSIVSADAPGAFTLGATISFENEIDTHDCRSLDVGGTRLAWVQGVQATAIGAVMRVCEAVGSNAAPVDGRVEGGLAMGWHRFDPATRKLVKLELPALDEMSNPSWCGRHVAYWAQEKHEVAAVVVVDLVDARVLARTAISRVELETDNLYHLTAAAWDAACTAATFADERSPGTRVIVLRP